MHKNYYLMIFVIVLCSISLYVVADHSNVVGSAYMSFDKYTVSLPPNYVSTNNNQYAQVYNPDLGYAAFGRIYNESSASSIIPSIENSSKYTILSKGIIHVGNIDVDSVYYRTPDNNNYSIFIFKKFNSSFQLRMNTFNYDDVNKTIEVASYFIDSLRINNKI